MPTPAIKQIRFGSYKAFSSDQAIDVKPLTLLYGYNNTGKSAIIRLLPFLAAGFPDKSDSTYESSYLNYQAESIRGASFSDLAYANGNRMRFGFTWEDNSSVDFSIKKDGAEIEQLEYLDFSADAKQPLRFIESLSGEHGKFHLRDKENAELNISNFNLSTCSSDSVDITPQLDGLRNLNKTVRWLSSIRSHPSRMFEIGAGIPIGIGSKGQRTAETLWHLAKIQSNSFTFVNKWLAQVSGRKIVTEALESNTIINGRRHVRLDTVAASDSTTTDKIRVPVLDLGEGIAQALPVVTLIAMAANGELDENPVICIEQPELHLHPKAIVELANFIVLCITQSPSTRLLLETHSESFLIALQIALVEKRICNNDIACYWVGNEDDNVMGSTVKRIEVDDEGFLSDNWSVDIFDEILIQQKQLVISRRQGQKAKE